jgi:hypothetical protein
MTEFGPLLQAAQHIQSLTSWIESGEMAELLADVEFSAAKASLSKVRMAADPRGQVWNAIGQLETAYQASVHIVRAHRSWENFSLRRSARADQARDKAEYILCMMAVCYRYLGENSLCKSHLDEIDRIGEPAFSLLGFGLLFASFATTAVLIIDLIPEIMAGKKPPPVKVSEEDLFALRSILAAS